MAMSRRAIGKKRNEESGAELIADEDDEMPRKKKRNAPRSIADFAGNIHRFAKALEKSDAVRLQFDRERFEMEMEQRDKDRKELERESALDREERRLEREENAKLELEKFKLMICVLASQNKN